MPRMVEFGKSYKALFSDLAHRPHTPEAADQFCWAAGFLTSGSAARCSRPTRDTFPLRSREQWSIAAFVPVTVAGAAPVSHRLPSPTNKRLRLSQTKISLSSNRSGRVRYRLSGTALKSHLA